MVTPPRQPRTYDVTGADDVSALNFVLSALLQCPLAAGPALRAVQHRGEAVDFAVALKPLVDGGSCIVPDLMI